MTLLTVALLTLAQAPDDAPKAASPERLLTVGVDEFSTDGLSRIDLQKLRFKLDEQRPGLPGPIGTLAAGAALDFLGVAGLVTSAIAFSLRGSNAFKSSFATDPFGAGNPTSTPTGLGYLVLITGVVGTLAGAVLTTWGVVWLKNTLAQRRLDGFKIAQVDEALAKTEPAEPAPAPAPAK